MLIKSDSSILSRLFYGSSFTDIWTPWIVILDLDNSHIEVLKKNWHLIGVDSQIIPFKNIRKLDINEHLFGADLKMKVYGGSIEAKCLTKKSALKIKESVLNELSSNKSIRIT